MAMSASFPSSRLPTLFDTPHISAAFMVIALSASSSPNPSLAAMPAHTGRLCISETGWSVIIATFTPALCRTPAVLKSIYFISILFLEARLGPSIAENPDCFISSAIRWPSEQWSSVMRRPNSFAILIAVSISSALCTCAFKGISPENTGAQHSSLKFFLDPSSAFLDWQ